MAQVTRLRRETPFYLIPIMMGMAGVLFAVQLDDPVLRGIIVLLCLGVPLFVGGNVLGRYQMGAVQRTLLLAGMAMLLVGAGYSLLGYAKSFGDSEMVSHQIAEISRGLGMGGLLLGLVVVLFSLIRSQALIQETSDRFRHVADHMADGFVLTGYDGTIVLVNRSFTELTGVPEDRVVGRNAMAIARELGAEVVGLQGENRAKGLASEYQVAWTPDGKSERQFWVSGSPVYDRRGRRVGAIATLRDVTEQHRMSKRLEEYAQGLQRLVEERTQQLRASEIRLRDLLQHMEEGFVTLDEDYRIRYANDRFCEMLRVERNALLQRPVIEFIQSEGCARLEKALEDTGAECTDPTGQEYALIRGDGAALPVKIAIAPIDDVSSDRLRYSLVLTDVHELKEMQLQVELRARQLEDANEELRRLDRAKDIFLSNVSHELRTPLSTLQGYIEMWEGGSLGAMQGPQHGALKVMARNAERLSRLINEMIEFSRMEIRGIRLHKTLFSPANLVEECVSSAQPQAMHKNITITHHVPESLTNMWGDREKICQVLGILLSNAVKFSPEGSHIQVRAERDTGGVIYSVSDTGIGISSEDQERIFAKFFQVDSSMTRAYQGTGIGLSIAKNIVEAHGGKVRVTSQPKKGSTFRVEIPHSAFEMDTQGDFQDMRDLRVFIANEQPEFRSALAALLAQVGCSCEVFGNAQECVRAARELQPDIFVVDETLPDLSGTDMADLLKEEISTATIPVIVLYSGKSGEGSAGQELVSGVSALRKPFTAERLVNLILKACAMSGQIGEIPVRAANTAER